MVPKNQPEKILPNLLTAINQYTEYEVGYEKRKVSCNTLVMKDRKNKIRTDGSAPQSKLYSTTSPYLQNGSIQKHIPLLNQVEDIHLPVINRTGIKFPVDLYFNHPLRENEVTKKELERYELKLRETNARLKVMAIRKKLVIQDK